MMNIELTWVDRLRFEGRYGEIVTAIDGDAERGVSPVAMLLEALAGCTAADVVTILRKARQELTGLRVRAEAERREEPPRRLTRVHLDFHVEGSVERRHAERAVRLSLETYCSVYHSLREDVDLTWELSVAAD